MDTAHNKDKEEEVVKVGREFEFGYFRLTNASYFMYQKVARYLHIYTNVCLQGKVGVEDDGDISAEDVRLALGEEGEEAEEAVHQRIEDLCQRIEEKQAALKQKREELRK